MKNLITLLLTIMIFSRLNLAQNYNPVANARAEIISGDARFTVLKPGVIRMEWAADKSFEDHASMVFINRNLPVPEFKTTDENGWLRIKTAKLTLRYKKGTGRFTDDNLKIEFEMDENIKEWTLNTPNDGNMKGTARTLDDHNGSYQRDTHEEIDLGTGIISRDGWVLIDDSKKPLFDNSKWSWVIERPDVPHQDLYFFCYGYNFKSALKDFTDLSGKIPIPPKYAFGAWWSRYWEYTDLELRQLIDGFHTHDVPLDVLVVDMDWHITTMPQWYKNGKLIKDQAGQRSGWTGFTWNKNYFPDPKNFLDWTKSQNLKVCLNLHPASGIQPHEAVYPEIARAMGIDPATKKYVPFDIVNKKYAKNFMNIVLNPLEKQGVDFWWIDWQQWSTTSIEGMNPTFYLNYVFFSDMRRENKGRPLILSRYGGLGSHRYVVGFSGDVSITWNSLNYQPYFTTTASNVGYGYWSHDLGGHTQGCSDGEMYTRWLQYGAFSPVFRTHETKNSCIERRIWAYPLKYFYPMRQAYRMRYAMIPYIYTEARKAFDTGLSLCRPMYYDHPKEENSYLFPDEYMFGDDLLMDPVTRPIGNDSLFVNQKIWLPEGNWYEWYTGSIVKGGRVVERSYTLDDIPLFAKAGSIIPMQPKMNNTKERPVDPLILNIIPGDSGKVSVYEDAGNDDNYLKGQFAFTDVRWKKTGDKSVVIIDPVRGSYEGMLKERTYEVRFYLTCPPKEVKINGKKINYRQESKNNSWTYNGDGFQTVVLTPRMNVNNKIVIEAKFKKVDQNILSGKKGQVDRLITFMKFLANNNWDKSKYSNDDVVYSAQLMHRLTMDPKNVLENVKEFEKKYDSVLEMIKSNSQNHVNFLPYYNLLTVTQEQNL